MSSSISEKRKIREEPDNTRLPMAPLLALAMAGFITILTEALPAGLLPQMSMGLGVSPSAIGQLITAYAVGSLIAAIPLTAVTIALIGWVWAKVPDYSGTTISGRASIRGTLAISGIKSILTVTLLFVLAHNILYTYIAPLVVPAGLAGKLDFVLLVFGVTAIAGICIVGYLVGRWLRELVLASIVLFGAAALMLGIWGDLPELFWLATGMWGLAFGGAATLFQTTAATTSGQASDVAQSMIVTAWNLAIAGGGTIGGLLLEHSDISWLAWSVLVLLLLAYVIAFLAKDRGFPSSQSAL
ncbi:hypothetical protein [Brucella pituitosa]|uniref:hypothetical protein n=1 Tax=Brucella pituitosa TaxID=571256 RepID=UPI003F4ADC97